MDHRTLVARLASAQEEVTSGEQLVNHQLELIEQLARDNRDTAAATELLTQLQEALASHMRTRDALQKQLAGLEQARQ